MKSSFREALKRLNSWINPLQMVEAVWKMESHLTTQPLIQINEEKCRYIRDGISVTVKPPSGKTVSKNALIMDFQNPKNNDFLAVQEMWAYGKVYHK